MFFFQFLFKANPSDHDVAGENKRSMVVVGDESVDGEKGLRALTKQHTDRHRS